MTSFELWRWYDVLTAAESDDRDNLFDDKGF
jgi:hypothetical protein